MAGMWFCSLVISASYPAKLVIPFLVCWTLDISHPMAPFGDWTFNPVESRVAGTGSPRPSNGPEGAMVGGATSAHTLSS